MRIAVLFLLAALPQEPPTSDLVADFLKGSAPAREALLKRGPDALLHLLEARKRVARLSSEEVAEREAATAGLRKLGPAAIPILEEGAKGADAEAAAGCRSLLGELRPKPPARGALPAAARWREQKLEGADLKVADALRQRRLDLAFEGSELIDILAFIRDFTEIRFSGGGSLPRTPVTFKVKDLALGEILELMTLPYGLDARIENGQVTIFERKK